MSTSLWICIIGGIFYFALSARRGEDGQVLGAIAELSRLAFFAGLLAYLLKG